jgi:Uma2 family endonuclease
MSHVQTLTTSVGEARVRSQHGQALLDAELRQWLEELLRRSAEPDKMTYEQFLAWADEDTHAEWVNGEVVMTSPASDQHQDTVDWLVAILRSYVQSRSLGWVRSAPFQMKLESGREPDLLFVTQANLERVGRTYLDGPADLVVEIASPESGGRDRGEKFYEYARGGVAEYWLIDPDTRWAEFYRLSEEGHYRTAFAAAEGVYHSAVIPGFWLRVEWLWQQPKPHPLQALGEIAGVDSETVARFMQALSGTG